MRWMNNEQAPLYEERERWTRVASIVTAAIGAIVLVGWAFDLPALRSAVPGAVEMKANTAIGLIGAATGLGLATGGGSRVRHGLRAAMSLFVLLLGTATLSQYAFHWDLRIDEILVRDTGAAYNQIKGRMSPYSAVAFCTLGIGMFALGRPALATVSRIAGSVVAAIAALSAIGYLWNATEIVTDKVAPPVAINTALALALLGFSMLWLSGPQARDVPRRSRSRLEALALGGFVPAALFVMVGGGLTYESGAGFARAAERVAHTQEVRAELGRLRSTIADAETAQRNHVLTGEQLFEQSFDEKADQAARHIALLRTLTADDPDQVRRLALAQAQVERRVAALHAIAAIVRDHGPNAGRVALADYVLARQTAEFEALVTQMDEAEDVWLAARLRQVESRRATTLLSLLATLTLLVAVFLMLFRAIRREMLARDRAEQALQRLNVDLEQRIAERTAELSHQQAFLRRVIDLDPNMIFAKDGDGSFVLANRALAEALGTTADEMIGLNERSFTTHHDEVRSFESSDRQVIDSGQEVVLPQETFTDASGRERWLSTVKRPIMSPDGTETIVLGVSVDITDRIRAEQDIRELNNGLELRVEERTRDLKESNVLLRQARLDSEAATRAKSAFLANMSHEIRTPMNAVIGLTHLMLRAPHDSVQGERLKKVFDAAKHLLQVINDILDMSKIEAGKMALESVEVCLDEVCAGAMAMMNTQARDKGLELVLDTDDLPARCLADPMRLSQILINLLSNAVKFTDHGWVRLRARVERELGQRLEVRFEVQDTGPGIPLERQSALFGAFEQADSSISRRHGGTGLGLALSRRLARAMDGEAGVVSSPGSGSVFWFTAWLTRSSSQPLRLAPPQITGRRALLVDDLPEARQVLGDRLRLLGLDVDSTDNGPAALSRVQSELGAGRLYDLMVIDWRMEPLDGIETLERLRRLLGDGTPPAILVTAFDDAGLSARASQAGYDAVLLKPVTHSSLQDAVANALTQSHAEEESAPTVSDGEGSVRARHVGQRVLLAEDNPVNREVAEQLLASAGLVVDTASDGARAIEMALSRHYDLVLMDVQMPILDGLEAAREIRRRAGYRTPIIAMTANAFAEDRAASIESGMNDHVPKPVDPAVLYATLLRWLPLRRETPAEAPGSGFGALPPEELRARLEGIEGIDIDAALRHVAGQSTVLAKVLARFADTYADGLPLLLNADDDGAERSRQWRTACHSVRGALSTIGAESLLAGVTSLESELSRDTPVSTLALQGVHVHTDLLRLVERIGHRLREGE